MQCCYISPQTNRLIIPLPAVEARLAELQRRRLQPDRHTQPDRYVVLEIINNDPEIIMNQL